jgi:hypothetical protein
MNLRYASEDRRPFTVRKQRSWRGGRQLCGVCGCSICRVTGRCGMAAPSVNTATND